MLAVKDNRQYTITQADVDYYQSQGFDILDDAGNIQTYGAGKTIAYSAYAKLKTEYDALQKEHETLKNTYADLEAAAHMQQSAADQSKTRSKPAGDK